MQQLPGVNNLAYKIRYKYTEGRLESTDASKRAEKIKKGKRFVQVGARLVKYFLNS